MNTRSKSKLPIVGQIKIERPCPLTDPKFEKRGDSEYCRHCDHTIYKTTELTPRQAGSIIRGAKEHCCFTVVSSGETGETIFKKSAVSRLTSSVYRVAFAWTPIGWFFSPEIARAGTGPTPIYEAGMVAISPTPAYWYDIALNILSGIGDWANDHKLPVILALLTFVAAFGFDRQTRNEKAGQKKNQN